MKLRINNQPHELPDGSTLADALRLLKAVPPFAAARNLTFVPNSQYAQTLLHEGDTLEIIRPVTGG